MLAAALGAVYAGPSVLGTARDGRSALIAGRDAIVDRDPDTAEREFRRARELFTSAEKRLSSPAVWGLRIVPIAGRHVALSRSLAHVGAGVGEAGIAAAHAMRQLPDRELRLVDGRVDLAAVRRASDAFGASVEATADIPDEIERLPSGWVVGPLARARIEARDMLPGAVVGLRKAQIALQALPGLLADNAKKRYIIAFSNLAELRGSGGFIGYVTALEAEDGDLDLEDMSGRPTELFPPPAEVALRYPSWFPDDFRTQSGIFQNVNLTTDFPTVGGLIVQTATPAVGPIDGVIGVDPIGIAAILRVTGPITVSAWPEPITPDNVSRIAQHDVYTRIASDDDRQEFFTQLVRTTFDQLVTGSRQFRPETFGSTDAAVGAGHFRMFSIHRDDQAAFVSLGLDGGVDRARSATDVLSVVSQNATGNKIDWFLRRNIRYEVDLEPDGSVAYGDLQVELTNDAPSSGLPDYVIGSPVQGIRPGTSRQIAMVVRPMSDRLVTFRVAGEDISPLRAQEGSLQAYRKQIDVAAQSRTGVRFESAVPAAFFGSGRELIYRLRVLPQPVARPDRLDVVIQPPRGWRVTGDTRFTGTLDRDVVLEVTLTKTLRATIVDYAWSRPWRLARQLIGSIF